MRIVSLLPSATEIVYALGLGDDLVGVSHDCDHPADVARKPRLSVAVVDPAWPQDRIDAVIRGKLKSGESVYGIDGDRLRELAPDLVLTQALCAVCAPSTGLVEEAAKSLAGRVRVESLEPERLEGVLENVARVGELTDRESLAADVIEGLRLRADHVRRLVAGAPRPRVACIEWYDPVMNAGHWVPDQVEVAGGEEVLARPGERSRAVDWTAVVAARPDVLVLMPCGFGVDRAAADLPRLSGRPGWGGIPAVRAGRVYAVDGSAYFNRPGPRLFTGIEILAEILHPEVFAGTAPPEAWRRVLSV